MKYIIILSLFLNGVTALAQSAADSVLVVKCDDDTAQSYSVYLPSNYHQVKPLPVIFLFDPAARGKMAVNLFKKAAETMDFIVMASNNSRNGPISLSLQAANSMFTDAFKKYSIDTKQIYLGGFSGGARIATIIASQNNSIAGILACGAGFADGIPNKPLPWSFEGTTGTRDFNYVEMQQVKQQLDGLHSTNNLIVFKGPHSWPPKPVILEALLWLDLQHRKNGLSGGDSNLLKYQSLIEAKIAKTPFLLEKVEMYRQLSTLNTAYAEKAKELAALKQYRDELAVQQKVHNKETAFQKRIREAISLIEQADTGIKPKSWWKTEFIILNKMQASGLSADSDFVWRQKATVNASISSDFENYYEIKKYDIAAEFLKIAEVFDADDPMVPYHYAQLAAIDGNENKALKYLETAVKQGFRNKKLISEEAAFQFMRANKRYHALIVD